MIAQGNMIGSEFAVVMIIAGAAVVAAVALYCFNVARADRAYRQKRS